MKKRTQKRTPKQLKALSLIREQVSSGANLSVRKAMREANYSEVTSNHPQKITNLPEFGAIVNEQIPEIDVVNVHKGLLKSTKLDHMVFPLGPEGEDDINLSGGVNPSADEDVEDEAGEEEAGFKAERTTLTDKEIISMLAEVNCTVRRIVHGETARHVYFWAPDNMARDKALDKAYKIRNRYPNPSIVTAVQINMGTDRKDYA